MVVTVEQSVAATSLVELLIKLNVKIFRDGEEFHVSMKMGLGAYKRSIGIW